MEGQKKSGKQVPNAHTHILFIKKKRDIKECNRLFWNRMGRTFLNEKNRLPQ